MSKYFSAVLIFFTCVHANAQKLDLDLMREKIIGAYTLSDPGLVELRHAVSKIPVDKIAGDQVIIELYQKATLNQPWVQEMLGAQNETGAWSDIDYRDKSRSGWAPKLHADRLLYLATAYSSKGAVSYQNTAIKKAIINGLHYWFKYDFISPNWWHNDIGVPKTLAPVFLMLQKDLSADDMTNAAKILDRSKIRMTGQNKAWLTTNVLMKAVLLKNEDLAIQARDSLLTLINTNDVEGIQADFSFHQHGAQQQFGNYGLAYILTMTTWAKVLNNTNLQLPDDKKRILSDLLLKGYSHITWKGMLDINAFGRQFFKYAQETKGLAVCFAMYDMMNINPANKGLYQAFINQQLRKDDLPSSLGNTYFYRSDMSVFQAKNWFVSIKMSSTRVIGAEAINNENKLGYYIADGATNILRTGTEYNNIFPFWDWRKIPGVTAYQSAKPLPAMKGGTYKNGNNFTGGINAQNIGIATTIIKRDSLTAHKAWFFIDNSLVCLGAGISTDSNDIVGTSINQCYLKGGVLYKGRNPEAVSQLKARNASLNAEWIHHDGIGYYFLQDNKVSVSAGYQSGRWHDIATTYPPEVDSARVFSLNINHSTAPKNASYAYVILPNRSKEDMARYTPGFSVLKNDASYQAILNKNGSRLMLVNYTPVSFKFLSNSIVLNHPGVYYFEKNKGKWEVYLSDPTQLLKTMDFKFNGKRYNVDLPQLKMAGSTAKKIL